MPVIKNRSHMILFDRRICSYSESYFCFFCKCTCFLFPLYEMKSNELIFIENYYMLASIFSVFKFFIVFNPHKNSLRELPMFYRWSCYKR